MTTTPKMLCQAALPTSGSTVYTVPALTTTILKSFDICNTTGSAIKARVHLVPTSGSNTTFNALIYDSPVMANTEGFPFGWEGEQVLDTGMSIYVVGSAAGLTITASGVEIT